ncbi:MAG: beta-carotene hydroxylase [Bacteroidia bacterium]
MTIIINILYALFAFVSMEAVAWLSHKYIMHGLLWFLHKDHHVNRPDSTVEHNDSFFIIFAAPAMVLFYFGFEDFSPAFWLAIGITAYGFAYFIIHDIFIHQRIKWLRNIDSLYFRAIRRAHKIHHKHLTKEDGECFGMLWVPLKYFRNELKNAR